MLGSFVAPPLQKGFLCLYFNLHSGKRGTWPSSGNLLKVVFLISEVCFCTPKLKLETYFSLILPPHFIFRITHFNGVSPYKFFCMSPEQWLMQRCSVHPSLKVGNSSVSLHWECLSELIVSNRDRVNSSTSEGWLDGDARPEKRLNVHPLPWQGTLDFSEAFNFLSPSTH